MKIIKIYYNNDCKFIIDIINNLDKKVIVEKYNLDIYKEKKKAIPTMTKYGTKNVPLLVFEDENLKEFATIWSESKPDWNKEIIRLLDLN